MNNKVKIILIHNTVAPYRHALFEKLSQVVDLMVYYCSVKHSSRKWDLWPRNYNYKYRVLRKVHFKTPTNDLSLNPSIVKEIVKNKPHIIIVCGYINPTMWLAFTIGIILKIPIIYWTEGIKEPQSFFGALTRPLRILFPKKSKAVLVPGRRSRNYVINFNVDVKKIFVAPNTIDNKLFISKSEKYRSFKEELKGQIGLKGKVVILYVGRVTEEKGINFLLEAYRKLKYEISDIALLIVGYGELCDIINEEKADDIVLTGAVVKFKQLIKYYSMADIFVFPTLGDVWGFVINEAMACGLPVISTHASQAATEMIRFGENGYIVKGADSNQLYEVLKNLVHNSELRRRMGEKSRKILINEFNSPLMVKGFLSAIKCCINGA
ncbi:MAG: glycosyltransferase family 4 protein [Candidatus Hodarchaeales archaeon]